MKTSVEPLGGFAVTRTYGDRAYASLRLVGAEDGVVILGEDGVTGIYVGDSDIAPLRKALKKFVPADSEA